MFLFGLLFTLGLKDDHKELWRKEPYTSRRRDQRKRCKAFKPDHRIDLRQMVFEDDHKVIMCIVPKVSI